MTSSNLLLFDVSTRGVALLDDLNLVKGYPGYMYSMVLLSLLKW